ncbi:MAG: hypothetical protein OEY95_02605 [Candidatus Bathyarchaeota archaeon]|nr:hypothetical protein [Candidatus Bathyarchaeota archaeon]MDH5754085.1 hypothetical protein [Candidatus Bathyarchaeota archaeon]
MSEKDDGKLIVKIDGKNLALNPFVQRIIRKAVLAMLSTLRDTEVQGNEVVEINVKRAAT